MVNLSHASQKGHASRGFMIDYCALSCSSAKLADPSHYLRSEFIRPEDVGCYREMGFHSFKILERGAPTAVLAQRVKAYAEESFSGHLLDLLQPYGYKKAADGHGTLGNFWRFARYFFRPGVIRQSGLMRLKRLAEKRGLVAGMEWDPVYIDNKALDGFLAGMKSIDCRQSDCSLCGYCATWTEKAVRVDGKFREEMLRLYHDAFEDMYSGDLWGLRGRGK